MRWLGTLLATTVGLVSDLSDREPPAGTVLVRAAGRDLGRVPVADPLVIDLPADLPLGRVTVEVIPDDGTRLTVASAAMAAAARTTTCTSPRRRAYRAASSPLRASATS